MGWKKTLEEISKVIVTNLVEQIDGGEGSGRDAVLEDGRRGRSRGRHPRRVGPRDDALAHAERVEERVESQKEARLLRQPADRFIFWVGNDLKI